MQVSVEFGNVVGGMHMSRIDPSEACYHPLTAFLMARFAEEPVALAAMPLPVELRAIESAMLCGERVV